MLFQQKLSLFWHFQEPIQLIRHESFEYMALNIVQST
jgi:hypothetical protein